MSGSLRRKIERRANEQFKKAAAQRLKNIRRDKVRKGVQLVMQQSPDGLSGTKRSRLIAAARRMGSDPRAKAITEKAALERQVQQVRREANLGNVSPPVYDGEPLLPHQIPKSVATQRNEERAKLKAERELSPEQERHTAAGVLSALVPAEPPAGRRYKRVAVDELDSFVPAMTAGEQYVDKKYAKAGESLPVGAGLLGLLKEGAK